MTLKKPRIGTPMTLEHTVCFHKLSALIPRKHNQRIGRVLMILPFPCGCRTSIVLRKTSGQWGNVFTRAKHCVTRKPNCLVTKPSKNVLLLKWSIVKSITVKCKRTYSVCNSVFTIRRDLHRWQIFLLNCGESTNTIQSIRAGHTTK